MECWPDVDEDVRLFLRSEGLARAATAQREALYALSVYQPKPAHEPQLPIETIVPEEASASKSNPPGVPRLVEEADMMWPPILPKGPLPELEHEPPTPPKKVTKPRPVVKKRAFPCVHCSKAFFRKHDLERHARVHSGDRPYVCRVCQKGFPRNDALRRHIRLERDTHQAYFPSQDSDVLVILERNFASKNS